MGSRVRRLGRHLGLTAVVGLSVFLSGAVVGMANGDASVAPPDRELRFARLAYNGNMFGGFGGRRGGGAWQTDAPDAEYHVLMGIRPLTRIAATEPEHALEEIFRTRTCGTNQRDEFVCVTALDDDLFEYPFIYAVEVGNWYLDDKEAE